MKFSLLIPDGWIVTNDTELDYAHAFGLGNITYQKGKPAQVKNQLGHRGGGVPGARFVIQSGKSSDLASYFAYSEEIGAIKTNGGLEGKKYVYTDKSDDEPPGKPG